MLFDMKRGPECQDSPHSQCSTVFLVPAVVHKDWRYKDIGVDDSGRSRDGYRVKDAPEWERTSDGVADIDRLLRAEEAWDFYLCQYCVLTEHKIDAHGSR
jgi:hypothetical protein